MIAPSALPKLWTIAHDRTEIPAGEFLEELAELPIFVDPPQAKTLGTVSDEDGRVVSAIEVTYSREGVPGIKLSQQTLSNYVRWGWVPRQRVSTAPGGRGQTGYFERRALIAAIVAHEEWAPHREEMTPAARKLLKTADFDAIELLESKLMSDYYTRGLFAGDVFKPIPSLVRERSEHDEVVLAHLWRAVVVGCLSRLLEAVPTDPLELLAFAPDDKGRAGIKELRELLDRALTTPVTGREEWSMHEPLQNWLASKPGQTA